MSPGWKSFEFFNSTECEAAERERISQKTSNSNVDVFISAVETFDTASGIQKGIKGGGGKKDQGRSNIGNHGNGGLPSQGPKETFWVGMSHGMVHCVEAPGGTGMSSAGSLQMGHASYRCLKSFPAMDGLIIGYIERVWVKKMNTTLLVVVGYSSKKSGYSVVVTCWDVSDEDSFEVLPKQIAMVSVFKSLKLPDSAVECMDVDCKEWPRVTIALGMESGGINLYSCMDIGAKKGAFSPVPFGAMEALRKKGDGPVTNVHFYRPQGFGMPLYVFGVTRYNMVGFDAMEGNILVQDQVGAGRHCSGINDLGELALCGNDGIFFYTIQDGRTVAVSLKGTKRMVAPCGNYMAIVTPAEDSSEGEHLQLVQVQQKIVAWNVVLDAPINILHIKFENSMGNLVVYVLDGAGILRVVSEKSVNLQVEELCKDHLFTQALAMCERGPKDEQEDLRARVNLIYGDYAFDRRDFAVATEAYINTIGFVETSHAIQKLLHAQQIGHLSVYLRALYDKNLMTGDHISLLIHAYVKLNSNAEIDSLVEDLCLNKLDCDFDTGAAIRVLRQTGFVQHALDIARTYNEDHLYISIMLREKRDYKEVVEYLRSRPRAKAADELKNNGKILLQNEPVATTALLMELCISPPKGSHDDFRADLADFAQIYIDNPQDLRYACEAILTMGTPDSPSRKRLYHTLLEMYLMKFDDKSSANQSNVHADAAMDLLKRGWTAGHEPWYNADDALASCRLHGFHRGLIFINVRLRRYRDAILTMSHLHDWAAILDICQTHGDLSQGGDPMVWHDALGSLSSSQALPGSEDYLIKLLGIIDENEIIPPLTVLDILAKNPDVKFGLVKKYFSRIFESEYECIKEHSSEIDQLRKSIKTQQDILDQAERMPRVFQSTKDSQTGADLELPLIHFMCGHSFNLRTLSDQDNPKCPLCSEEHSRIKAMAQSFKSAATDKDSFFRQLHGSDDAFAFIAEAFGKGYMD